MTMVPNFSIVFIFSMFIFTLFLEMQHDFAFSYEFDCLVVSSLIFFISNWIFSSACSFKVSPIFLCSLDLYMLYSYILWFQMLKALKNFMEYVEQLLLWTNFQKHFYIDKSFLLNTQDLHKQQLVFYQIFGID